MKFDVYTTDLDGRHLLAENVSYEDALIYKDMCSNVEIVDPSNDNEVLPNDGYLLRQYGLDKRTVESAAIVLTCAALGTISLIAAAIYAAFN